MKNKIRLIIILIVIGAGGQSRAKKAGKYAWLFYLRK